MIAFFGNYNRPNRASFAIRILPLAAILVGLYLATNSTALATTLDQCLETARFVKKFVPSHIDSITTITNVSCLPGKTSKSKIVFTYIVHLDVMSSELKGKSMQGARAGVLRSWCTDPNKRSLLVAYDVAYRYYATDGTYFDEIILQNRECPNI